jgi:hypothetical protein
MIGEINRERYCMGAPFGNQNNKKLTTDELKKAAYDSFCKHIAEGKSIKSWYFEHPNLTITYKTMLNYIEAEPVNFPPIHREVAESKSLEVWEAIGTDMLNSERRTQPAIYQMFMRNKFGWDKESTAEREQRLQHEQSMLEKVYNSLHDSYKAQQAKQQ